MMFFDAAVADPYMDILFVRSRPVISNQECRSLSVSSPKVVWMNSSNKFGVREFRWYRSIYNRNGGGHGGRVRKGLVT
jgi:hypothetical protein